MKKVFFTGHRESRVYTEDMHKAINLLRKFIIEGVVDFYAGGARGWDMTFESMVMNLRENHFPLIKLHLILPCPPDEQIKDWGAYDKQQYQKILKAADSVEIVSEHYDKNCMKKRNERLVQLGDICVCYYNEKHKRSGTGQTVRMAQKQGKEIINLYVDRTET
ncbi:MAG: SLOG family protein [Oscillospiraceae bacterium]|nr:SLOG family protein [Oscillospiraceae bacterium]